MGRSYAACLGCLGLASCIVYGIAANHSVESTLTRSITTLFGFAILGWIAGQAADQAVRNSLEIKFREKIERLRQRNSNEPSTGANLGGLGNRVKQEN